ncbi:hypothetical protein Tco_1010131 [Tanacetum coccineum]
MLYDFDRQDVLDLHRLVQERYDTTSLEGYDLLLWGDLKILFEPNKEDEIWKNQQDYNLISWRLFDSCGIHMLLMHTGIAIHMMIEKKYPLTQEMLSRMLSRRLEVDQESEMAFELLRNSADGNSQIGSLKFHSYKDAKLLMEAIEKDQVQSDNDQTFDMCKNLSLIEIHRRSYYDKMDMKLKIVEESSICMEDSCFDLNTHTGDIVSSF